MEAVEQEFRILQTCQSTRPPLDSLVAVNAVVAEELARQMSKEPLHQVPLRKVEESEAEVAVADPEPECSEMPEATEAVQWAQEFQEETRGAARGLEVLLVDEI